MDELIIGPYRLRMQSGSLVAYHDMLAKPVELPAKSLESWIARRVRDAIVTAPDPVADAKAVAL